MMTEEDAKQKLCPLTFNHPDDATHCIASTCATWVWDDGTARANPCTYGHCGLIALGVKR